MVELVMLISNL